MATEPYQWRREVRVAGNSYRTRGEEDDIHQDITIEQGEKDKITATCNFWNLSRSTWNGIKEEDPIEIALGYLGGPFETCLIGTVTKVKSPEAQGPDTKYTLEAQDESEGRLRATRFTTTLDSPTICQIVREVAGQSGVAVAECNAPGKAFERKYPINRDKTANRWLDRMKSEAEERDPESRTYDWHASEGKLWFRPDEEAEAQSAVVLKKASPKSSGNIESIDISEGGTKKSDGPPDLDFEAYLDPRLRKDGMVSVTGGTKFDGVYRVTKYTIESSVTDRVHKMSGTLSEPSAKFRVKDGQQGGA